MVLVGLVGVWLVGVLVGLVGVCKGAERLGKEQRVTAPNGIVVETLSFEGLIKRQCLTSPCYLMSPKGQSLTQTRPDEAATFILTDQVPLSKNALSGLKRQGVGLLSLGRNMLFASPVWQNEVYVHFCEGTCGARVCACHVGTSLAPIPRLSFVAAPSPAAHFHADPASSAHAALARATVQRVAFRVPILVWTIGTDPRDVTIWVMHVRKHRCACAYFLRSSSSFFCCCFRFSSSSSWSMSFTRWF